MHNKYADCPSSKVCKSTEVFNFGCSYHLVRAKKLKMRLDVKRLRTAIHFI